jgi:SAM-dependent methyltransferase
MTFKIRLAVPSDREFLVNFMINLQEFERKLHPNRCDGILIGSDHLAYLERLASDRNGCILVAESLGELVGFLVCFVEELEAGDRHTWDNESFDRTYSIWFLEHLDRPENVLQEAYRVLKTGGTIALNETDYRTILIEPESSDYQYLQNALCELLIQSGGNPYIGRKLGLLLQKTK